jgi:hypothetical protein
MNHTHRLTNGERLARLEERLRMLSYLAAGQRESVPPPEVWTGLSAECEELAGELHEVRVGLPGEIQDAPPVDPAPRHAGRPVPRG